LALDAKKWDRIKYWAGVYNVDPALLAAIGQHETGWGDLGDGRKGMYLGYGSYDNGSDYGYAGLDKQLKGAASKMAAWGMRPGQVTLDGLKAGNAGRLATGIYATDRKWPDSVYRIYLKMKNDPLNSGGSTASYSSQKPYVEGGTISAKRYSGPYESWKRWWNNLIGKDQPGSLDPKEELKAREAVIERDKQNGEETPKEFVDNTKGLENAIESTPIGQSTFPDIGGYVKSALLVIGGGVVLALGFIVLIRNDEGGGVKLES
jgi:hypothetical protein